MKALVKRSKMRVWLKRNKIIFETIVAASLTVMGILVSIAAVFVAVNANKLVDRQNELIIQQYELERYGAEPVFTVEWEMGEDKFPRYVIKNVGAEIHDVHYSVERSWIKGYFPPLGSQLAFQFTFTIEKNGISYNLIKMNTPFSERTQSFSISAFRLLQEEEEPYFFVEEHMVEELKDIVDTLSMDNNVYIRVKYKNLRNEECEKSILIESYFSNYFQFGELCSFAIGAVPKVERVDCKIELQYNENHPLEKIHKELSDYLVVYQTTP